MPKVRRRDGWWRSLEPFDLLVMVCAVIAVPVVIAYLMIGAAIFVLYFASQL